MSDDASKKTAGPAAAASASTDGAPPVSPLVIPSTNSYVFFSLLLFPLMITTYAVCVDVLGYHLPVCCMSSMRMFVNLGNCIVMIYTWIKLMRKLLIISTVGPPKAKHEIRDQRMSLHAEDEPIAHALFM